jgi:hypothetical protein
MTETYEDYTAIESGNDGMPKLIPEEFRGTGVGKMLLKKAMDEFPSLGGQIHSKAAAVNAYKAGRRPYGNPDATLEDVFDMMNENSSVNMVTTE